MFEFKKVSCAKKKVFMPEFNSKCVLLYETKNAASDPGERVSERERGMLRFI